MSNLSVTCRGSGCWASGWSVHTLWGVFVSWHWWVWLQCVGNLLNFINLMAVISKSEIDCIQSQSNWADFERGRLTRWPVQLAYGWKWSPRGWMYCILNLWATSWSTQPLVKQSLSTNKFNAIAVSSYLDGGWHLFFLYCDRGLRKDDDERERERERIQQWEGWRDKAEGVESNQKKDIHKRLSGRKREQRKVIFIIGVLAKIPWCLHCWQVWDFCPCKNILACQ